MPPPFDDSELPISQAESLAHHNVIRRAKTGQSSAPKTGHRVGGISWKNRLVRTCLQGA